ncbi:hypothetical protein [Photobacterium phosphoreum]|uniref:hypothetical protein n=1 Tax=Photobacterium phosphoreum TaxID=659 RepID=UPI0015E7802A|nr:hypothetical protein [Photobacterium phosphoreum]
MTKVKTPMTPEDFIRIQSEAAKKNGGKTPKNSFIARAQRVIDKKSNNKII